MTEAIIILTSLFAGFIFGYFICAVMSSGRCQECRLKEVKEFKDDSN